MELERAIADAVVNGRPLSSELPVLHATILRLQTRLQQVERLAAGMFHCGGNFDDKTADEIRALGLDLSSKLNSRDGQIFSLNEALIEQGNRLDAATTENERVRLANVEATMWVGSAKAEIDELKAWLADARQKAVDCNKLELAQRRIADDALRRLEATLKSGEEYYRQLMEERKLRHAGLRILEEWKAASVPGSNDWTEGPPEWALAALKGEVVEKPVQNCTMPGCLRTPVPGTRRCPEHGGGTGYPVQSAG